MNNRIHFLLIFLATVFLLPACNNPKSSMEQKTLKVMTLNIWSGLDYKGTVTMGLYESDQTREARYQALISEIKEKDPDIIGLNEVNARNGFLRRLTDDLNYDAIFHVGVSGLKIGTIGIPWNLREGDAVLAKKGFNLQEVGRQQLSGGGFIWNYASFHLDDATQVLVGKITVNNKTIYAAVTHFHASPPDLPEYRKLIAEYSETYGYSESESEKTKVLLTENQEWRNKEFTLLDEYLSEVVPAGEPLIVLGDFNADSSWPEIKRFQNKGYLDTFAAVNKEPKYTWDANENQNIQTHYLKDLNQKRATLYSHLDDTLTASRLTLDYIFTKSMNGPDSVVQSDLCADSVINGVHPSDHFGVITELRL
jgi:endonuclease/exonuclease/phosphatase family metal-dependent hydrolase